MDNDVFNKFRLDGKSLAIKTIQNKIEQLISSGTYNNLEDFIKDNADLGTFQNHTKLNNTLQRVWGYKITEEEYLVILEELKKKIGSYKVEGQKNIANMSSGQAAINHPTINTTMNLDNPYMNNPIENHVEKTQQDSSQLLAQDNNIIQFKASMSKGNGMTEVTSLNTRSSQETVNAQKRAETEEIIPKQKTLQMQKQAGYSNALVLAFITGLFLGIMFLSSYVKAILP